MKQNVLEKLKSPVAWVSLLTLIFLIVKHWFGFEIPAWDEIVEAILACLVAFGITNNPNSRSSW